MKLFRIYTLLLCAALSAATTSCDEGTADSGDSIISSFAEFSAVTPTGSPIVVQECGDATVQLLHFTLDSEKQVTDLTIEIAVGESSTATEGEDFDLLTHEVSIPALGGQDGFDVEIVVYQDFVIEDSDESIYLSFDNDGPSGLEESELHVATIDESGLTEDRNQIADFGLSWEYTADPTADICADGYDLDLTLQTAGSPPYNDDLLNFDASSLACPEAGVLDMADMNEGELYEMWVWVYAGADPAENMTIRIDYDRAGTDFTGEFVVTGVFNSGMDGEGVMVGTIEKNCDVLTIKDTAGDVVAEGRVSSTDGLHLLHNVKKPF